MIHILKTIGKWSLLFSMAPAFAQPQIKPIEVNIGIYAPFSNKQAFIGRNMLGAMELARDKLKNHTINYSFYTFDELPTTDKNAANTLERFVAAHHIDVLLTEGSRNGLMAATVAQKNHLIHFSLASDPKIADGSTNFLAMAPEQEKVLFKTNELKQQLEFVKEYQEAYMSYPTTEAGYTFDLFNLLNKSVLASAKKSEGFSSSAVAQQIHAVAISKGVMGTLNLDKQGVLLAQSGVKGVNGHSVVTG